MKRILTSFLMAAAVLALVLGTFVICGTRTLAAGGDGKKTSASETKKTVQAKTYSPLGTSRSTKEDNILTTIPKDTLIVLQTKEKNDWFKVIYKGQTGYVKNGTYLLIGDAMNGESIDLKKIKFEDVTVHYDGKAHKLPKVKKLPKGVKVKYSTTKKQKKIGEYEVKATFTAKKKGVNLLNAEERTAKLIILAKKGATFEAGGFTVKVTNDGSKGKRAVKLIAPRKKDLKTVKIPKTVKIGGASFSVRSIGKNAFKGCRNLTEVQVGDRVRTIEENAFANCPALTQVKLGKGVRKLGKKVFAGDAALTKLTISSKKLKKVGSGTLQGIAENAVIKVPKAKLKKYRKLFAGKGQPETVTIKK